MANSKGPSTVRNLMYNGKNSLLPPKSPFPSISPSYAEYIPNNNSTILPKSLPKPRDGYSHQRTSSESFLPEEQPSWLDELLNEPDTPVRKGHRRSSSDSFAYIDSTNSGRMNYIAQDDNKFKTLTPVSAWGSPEFDIYRDVQQNSFYADPRTKNKLWDMPVSSIPPPRCVPLPREKTFVPNAAAFNTSEEAHRNLSSEKQGLVEFCPQDPKGSGEKDISHVKSLETDTKRAKQQFAQRSRVRKLQYIAELERNVQALQVEGSEVSAELEFLNQQNLILSMENKALKQRLENLGQEQLIKYLEHEVLEKEVGRLQNLYKQQQQPLQQQIASSGHRRGKSRDLDQQFATLSMKPKETGTGNDSVSGQLHI